MHKEKPPQWSVAPGTSGGSFHTRMCDWGWQGQLACLFSKEATLSFAVGMARNGPLGSAKRARDNSCLPALDRDWFKTMGTWSLKPGCLEAPCMQEASEELERCSHGCSPIGRKLMKAFPNAQNSRAELDQTYTFLCDRTQTQRDLIMRFTGCLRMFWSNSCSAENQGGKRPSVTRDTVLPFHFPLSEVKR